MLPEIHYQLGGCMIFVLVDITNEGTELGIVRHNALQYSTHIPFGRASIAREIAAATASSTYTMLFQYIRTLRMQTF